MEWTQEAEDAIRKVPFFVRKKVRARVEQEANQNGKIQVTPAEVKATQQRYLTGMKSEVKGYQLDTCFGPSGCPHAVGSSQGLVDRIETLLKEANFLGFLKSKGIENLKFHHEFRVTVADCPNACSQPQIKDIGIIGAALPIISSEEPCTACEACVEACREDAVAISEPSLSPRPSIDKRRCLACGQCIRACPGGTIMEGTIGYRIQLGGKLGRHPQLALEIPGIYDTVTTLNIVSDCIDLYQSKSQKGERFGQIIKPADINALARRYQNRSL